jgi:succinoglycan biosynthesis transport protein ExoP
MRELQEQIEDKELLPVPVIEHQGGIRRGARAATWGPEENHYVSFTAAWNILLKRRATVITVVVIVITLTAIYSYRMQPVYKAQARLFVEADSAPIRSLNELSERGATDEEFVQTQIEVLKSDNLAWQAIEQLHLENAPQFAKALKLAQRRPDRRKMAMIAAFKDHLSVDLVPKTRMIVVGFESTDPKLAAQVASAQVQNYVNYSFNERYEATRKVSGWLEQQLDELKAKVEESQQRMVDYERQNSIASMGEASTGPSGSVARQNVTEQMLSDLIKELANARADRIQKQAKYEQVKHDRKLLASLAENDLVKQLLVQQSELKNQFTEALNQYGPKFPKVLRLQQQISENEASLQSEQNRVIDRERQEYMAALDREQLAANAVGKQKQELSNLNQKMVQHNILRRDFETNQQLYQNLLQRLKDANVSVACDLLTST